MQRAGIVFDPDPKATKAKTMRTSKSQSASEHFRIWIECQDSSKSFTADDVLAAVIKEFGIDPDNDVGFNIKNVRNTLHQMLNYDRSIRRIETGKYKKIPPSIPPSSRMAVERRLSSPPDEVVQSPKAVTTESFDDLVHSLSKIVRTKPINKSAYWYAWAQVCEGLEVIQSHLNGE